MTINDLIKQLKKLPNKYKEMPMWTWDEGYSFDFKIKEVTLNFYRKRVYLKIEE